MGNEDTVFIFCGIQSAGQSFRDNTGPSYGQRYVTRTRGEMNMKKACNSVSLKKGGSTIS